MYFPSTKYSRNQEKFQGGEFVKIYRCSSKRNSCETFIYNFPDLIIIFLITFANHRRAILICTFCNINMQISIRCLYVYNYNVYRSNKINTIKKFETLINFELVISCPIMMLSPLLPYASILA